MFNFLRVNVAGDALLTGPDELLIVDGYPARAEIHAITIAHGPRTHIEYTDQQNDAAGSRRNASDRNTRLRGLIHKRR